MRGNVFPTREVIRNARADFLAPPLAPPLPPAPAAAVPAPPAVRAEFDSALRARRLLLDPVEQPAESQGEEVQEGGEEAQGEEEEEGKVQARDRPDQDEEAVTINWGDDIQNIPARRTTLGRPETPMLSRGRAINDLLRASGRASSSTTWSHPRRALLPHRVAPAPTRPSTPPSLPSLPRQHLAGDFFTPAQRSVISRESRRATEAIMNRFAAANNNNNNNAAQEDGHDSFHSTSESSDGGMAGGRGRGRGRGGRS
ncbi:hypothetical protein LX32DRAFT_698570 [Colletotrichum zoysiae]|uniref:Uncharacterized protein n=1 Tax=Colletotrichum zoysiae TaxID=1216348 RepID=A0AAD9LYB6_9PEZI|nr:hypothetical protein LX32DRAFT_698570 [Colletotrichum zoysiae]